MLNRLKIILVVFSLFSFNEIYSQEIRVKDIYINQLDVFQKNEKEWFFGAGILNSLHINTMNYLIEDEILFPTDEWIDVDYIYETERNLRATNLFTYVSISLDSLSDDTYNVNITTKDKWSLYPAVKYRKTEDYYYLGGVVEEHNFLGTGTYLNFELADRTENKIGLQGDFKLRQRRLFRSEYGLDFHILANKYKTEQSLSLLKEYRTLDTKNSYGIIAENSFGNDFLYSSKDSSKLLPFNEKQVKLFYSQAWERKDKIFASGLVEYYEVDRLNPDYNQALDNCGKILLMFSSVSNEYYTISNVNSYLMEDLPVGGYGSATLGKIFSIGSKGEDLYYVGGQGERSYYDGKLYLFGQITGASGFKQSIGKYTYEEFLGTGFFKLNNTMLLAARIRQQTAWNWYAWRQLIMDSDNGIRGFPANHFLGENRIVSNLELRVFPDWQWWVLNFSGVLFYDNGTVWNQSEKISSAKFYNAIGAGLRLHFTKSTNPEHIFRIDLAYNLTDGKIGGVVLSTKQMFDAFVKHTYKLPQIFGLDFNEE